MCLLYLKVICARPWGPKEAFGVLKSPKTPPLTALFLRPFASGHPVITNWNVTHNISEDSKFIGRSGRVLASAKFFQV